MSSYYYYIVLLLFASVNRLCPLYLFDLTVNLWNRCFHIHEWLWATGLGGSVLFPHSHTFLCVLCSLFSKPFNQGSISNNHFTNTWLNQLSDGCRFSGAACQSTWWVEWVHSPHISWHPCHSVRHLGNQSGCAWVCLRAEAGRDCPAGGWEHHHW